MQNKSVVNPLGLDELVFKISLNVKDPLRKSVPDKEQASAIQEANKMADGTVSVSIKIVDDSSVDVYRDPLKKLQKFYYENTLPIGKGKQPHRIVSTMNLNKFKKEFDQLILDVQDGMKKFKDPIRIKRVGMHAVKQDLAVSIPRVTILLLRT